MHRLADMAFRNEIDLVAIINKPVDSILPAKGIKVENVDVLVI
jgi:hypothetical protein